MRTDLSIRKFRRLLSRKPLVSSVIAVPYSSFDLLTAPVLSHLSAVNGQLFSNQLSNIINSNYCLSYQYHVSKLVKSCLTTLTVEHAVLKGVELPPFNGGVRHCLSYSAAVPEMVEHNYDTSVAGRNVRSFDRPADQSGQKTTLHR